MMSTETPLIPEDGLIERIQSFIDSYTEPIDVTHIVAPYVDSIGLIKVNFAIRFCCSIGMKRPKVVAVENGRYMLIGH